MEDADKNSKSLVLITRVGSTPTTGIKKKLPSSSGEFLFYLRRVRGSVIPRIKKVPETFAGVPGAGFYAETQASSRLTMASIWSKHSSIWRTRVNWVRARSRLWSGRAVWK